MAGSTDLRLVDHDQERRVVAAVMPFRPRRFIGRETEKMPAVACSNAAPQKLPARELRRVPTQRWHDLRVDLFCVGESSE